MLTLISKAELVTMPGGNVGSGPAVLDLLLDIRTKECTKVSLSLSALACLQGLRGKDLNSSSGGLRDTKGGGMHSNFKELVSSLDVKPDNLLLIDLNALESPLSMFARV